VCDIIDEMEETWPGFFPATPGALSRAKAEHVGNGLRFEYRQQLRHLLMDKHLTYEALLEAARSLEADKEAHKAAAVTERKKGGMYQVNTQVGKTQARKDLYVAPKTGRTQPNIQVRSTKTEPPVTLEDLGTDDEEDETASQPSDYFQDVDFNQLDETLVRFTTAYESARRDQDFKEGKCFYCHEPGHQAAACPSKAKPERSGNDKRMATQKGSRPSLVRQEKTTPLAPEPVKTAEQTPAVKSQN
jgi:hypothetical protein